MGYGTFVHVPKWREEVESRDSWQQGEGGEFEFNYAFGVENDAESLLHCCSSYGAVVLHIIIQ